MRLALAIMIGTFVILITTILIPVLKTSGTKSSNTVLAMELWDSCGGERVKTITVSESGGLAMTVNCFTNGGEGK